MREFLCRFDNSLFIKELSRAIPQGRHGTGYMKKKKRQRNL